MNTVQQPSIFAALPGMRRWRAALAVSLMALTQLPALAQQAEAIDPPGRVARLNLMEGPVSFAAAPAEGEADNNWTQAQLNRPITSGDRLWTDQQARSELHIGSTTVRMNEQTSLDFMALDDDVTQLRLAQGTLNLRVRNLYEGQRLEVNTPNLAFVVSQPGDYRLDVNPQTNVTRVVVQTGAGLLYGDSRIPVNLASQQQASFTSTQLIPAGPGAATLDSFDQWASARDRAEDQSVSARYIPREIVGYQQLDNYGDWSQDPSYGAVWLPRAVPANWAPYRAGHWSFIRPWGWTWIDDAPWGFAPSHYGRWAQIGPRWAWVPGRLARRPVYAPALVAFVGGNSGGVNWSISIGGGAQPALGWFPLAPGEAYRPAYRSSTRYVTRINQNIVVNNITNVTNVYRYQRTPAAVTAVSTADFVQGRPVRPDATRVAALTQADLGRAQLVDGNRGLPQRQASREQARRTASALPPAIVNTRPVVGLRDGRLERRDERPDRGAANTSPTTAIAQPRANQPPEARNTAEQQRQPVERNERQPSARRQPEAGQNQQGAQGNPESLGQRAAREQAQRNALPQANAAAAGNLEQERRAQQAQQQMQRDQQRQQRDLLRQQRDLLRQQEAQRRQSEESLGQRAQREQAAKQQQDARDRAHAQRAQEQQHRQQLQTQQREAQRAEQQTAREQQRAPREQQQQRREARDANAAADPQQRPGRRRDGPDTP